MLKKTGWIFVLIRLQELIQSLHGRAGNSHFPHYPLQQSKNKPIKHRGSQSQEWQRYLSYVALSSVASAAYTIFKNIEFLKSVYLLFLVGSSLTSTQRWTGIQHSKGARWLWRTIMNLKGFWGLLSFESIRKYLCFSILQSAPFFNLNPHTNYFLYFCVSFSLPVMFLKVGRSLLCMWGDKSNAWWRIISVCLGGPAESKCESESASMWGCGVTDLSGE